MKRVGQFYRDEMTRKDVKAYQMAVIKDRAGEMAVAGKSTDHIKQAKALIEDTYKQMQEDFERDMDKDKPKNQAR